MRTVLFIFGILSCAALHAQQNDKLSVWTSGDTAIVTDVAGYENCAARFAFEVTSNGNTFRITQRDTVKEKMRCMCRFELTTMLVGYAPGTYTAEVYREYLAKFGYGSDTVVYIGSVTFDLATHTRPMTGITNSQTDCITTRYIDPVDRFGFTIYPVPVRGAAYMDFDERWIGRVTVTVYDECGQRVQTAFDGRYDGGRKWLALTDAAFPASGLYHVVVETPIGIVSKMVPVVK
ncbi:MAG: hypothetical protein IPP94_11890 [Ignavibacteria bacterium]|nr:hypothetical protein [Ignavibacteria bacterium]